jgi:hypothetical protein
MAGVVASTAGNETSIKSSGWAAEMIRTVYPNTRSAMASTEPPVDQIGSLEWRLPTELSTLPNPR